MNNDLLKMLMPELTEGEVRELCRAKKEELGFDIEKAIFPHKPFDDAPLKIISLEGAIELARELGVVRDSAHGLVRTSVWRSGSGSASVSEFKLVSASVSASVSDSVWDLVWVWDSVSAYISSIFFNIEKWEGIEHENGVNPFQPAIDLWESGYVPVYIGNKIQLHTKDGLVWEEVNNEQA